MNIPKQITKEGKSLIYRVFSVKKKKITLYLQNKVIVSLKSTFLTVNYEEKLIYRKKHDYDIAVNHILFFCFTLTQTFQENEF